MSIEQKGLHAIPEKPQNRARRLSDILQDPNLDRYELRKAMDRVGDEYFMRNRKLFVLVDADLIRKAGFTVSHDLLPGDIGDIVEYMKTEGAMEIGQAHRKIDGGRAISYFFFMRDDIDHALDVVRDYQKL